MLRRQGCVPSTCGVSHGAQHRIRDMIDTLGQMSSYDFTVTKLTLNLALVFSVIFMVKPFFGLLSEHALR